MNNSQRIKQFFVAGATCLALSVPTAANAAIFLQLDPSIKGESVAEGYKDWIMVESWSWGLSRASAATSGARAMTKLCASDIAIQKSFDRSSPGIITNMVSGKPLPKVKLAFTRLNGDVQAEYLTIELANVQITSYQVSGSGDERPFDSVSLNFQTGKVTYMPQNPDGSLGAPIVSTVADNC